METMKAGDPDLQIIHTIGEEEDEDDLLYNFTFSCKTGGDKHNPISVEMYTDSTHLQGSFISSFFQSKPHVINLSDDDELSQEVKILKSQPSKESSQEVKILKSNPSRESSQEVMILKSYPARELSEEVKILKSYPARESSQEVQLLKSYPSRRISRRVFSGPSISETGQSSASKPAPEPVFCKICMEPKNPNEIFTVSGCRHVFCSDCIGQHVAAKIQDNAALVRCPEPGCEVTLDPIVCRPILPQDVFDRWGSVLCESLILGLMKFYCPFKDCSALLLDEGGEDGSAIVESECPHCRRLFCAQCKVEWHSGIGCVEFQNLKGDEREREDIMLMNLAKENKWQRCPKCGFYVEKIEGCLFMRCRCSHCFCYHCAGPVDERLHYCARCRH
ncbi:E3 ubiquitin-protein ligase RSL1-like [Magnolia sinica]|uniref:E3 ubiquitin-protein ligase RSL1-like n=1 Tax=Magnolia sinica TaxID=86752 RepID=UPI002658493D|nr:E3 ubiquitin-protein ligase RSL1-like [Magnolia sinica]